MSLVSTLEFPKKSHRKFILYPKYSPRLAEFFGIMIGDGGINNPWQANITLNSIKDRKYSIYILKLCLELFGVMPAIRKRKTRNTLVVSLAGTSIVDFLVDNGLPRGDKLKNGLRIPKWILSKKACKVACVRGLMDTDGCLFMQKYSLSGKTRGNIGLCFSSNSPELIAQVVKIFKEFKITSHVNSRGNNIYLYKEGSVVKYMEVFGTSNDRISTVFNNWRGARAV